MSRRALTIAARSGRFAGDLHGQDRAIFLGFQHERAEGLARKWRDEQEERKYVLARRALCSITDAIRAKDEWKAFNKALCATLDVTTKGENNP